MRKVVTIPYTSEAITLHKHILLVKQLTPSARLEMYGSMYHIKDGDRCISEPKTSPLKAWMSAYTFLNSGGL